MDAGNLAGLIAMKIDNELKKGKNKRITMEKGSYWQKQAESFKKARERQHNKVITYVDAAGNTHVKMQAKEWNPLADTMFWKILMFFTGQGGGDDNKMNEKVNSTCMPNCDNSIGDPPQFTILWTLFIIIFHYVYTVPNIHPILQKNFQTTRSEEAVQRYVNLLDASDTKAFFDARTLEDRNEALLQATVPASYMFPGFNASQDIPQLPNFPHNFIEEEFVFYPWKRWQIWRYVTYSFVHIDNLNLWLNVVLFVLGCLPLELVHGTPIVATIYINGVIAGSLFNYAVNHCILTGMASGTYAIIFSHWANYVLNLDIMSSSYALMYIIAANIPIGVIFLFDLIKSIVDQKMFRGDTVQPYIQLFAGLITALLFAMHTLKNFEIQGWEEFFRHQVRFLYYLFIGTLILVQPKQYTHIYEVNSGGAVLLDSGLTSVVIGRNYRSDNKVCLPDKIHTCSLYQRI